MKDCVPRDFILAYALSHFREAVHHFRNQNWIEAIACEKQAVALIAVIEDYDASNANKILLHKGTTFERFVRVAERGGNLKDFDSSMEFAEVKEFFGKLSTV